MLYEFGFLGGVVGARRQYLVDVADVVLVFDLRSVDAEVSQLLRRAIVQLNLGESRNSRDKHQSDGNRCKHSCHLVTPFERPSEY